MSNDTKFKRSSDGVLPVKRTQLFFYILKWRFTYLLAIGLLLLVFVLPFLALFAYYDISAAVIEQSADNISARLVSLKIQTSMLQIFAYVALLRDLEA